MSDKMIEIVIQHLERKVKMYEMHIMTMSAQFNDWDRMPEFNARIEELNETLALLRIIQEGTS